MGSESIKLHLLFSNGENKTASMMSSTCYIFNLTYSSALRYSIHSIQLEGWGWGGGAMLFSEIIVKWMTKIVLHFSCKRIIGFELVEKKLFLDFEFNGM